MPRRFSIPFLLLLLATAASVATAQVDQTGPPPDLPAKPSEGDRLSLSQAIQIGLRENPQIKAAQSSVESARQNYNSQKAPINPTIAYAALNNSVAPFTWSNGFDQGSNYSIYATIETNGAIRYRTAQAREAYHQAQFDASTTGLSLKLSVINAYVGLQIANRALEIELKVYDNIHKLTELTQKRFEAGAGPQADLTRATIADIQEKQNVITDVANVNQARATLNAQLGRPQAAPIDTAEPLVYKHVGSLGLDRLTALAEIDRPELLSAKANLLSLQAVPGLERSAYFPNVLLGKDLGNDGQIFIGLSMPLDLGGIRGAVSKANADVKTQRSQVELQRQSIDLDVKSSYVNFEAAQKQIDTYDTGILKLSETLVDQVRHGYELGANTIVDILSAENTFRSVESAYYAAVGNYIVNAYTLKHSIGELPDSLSSDDLTDIGAGNHAASKEAKAR